VSVSCLGVVVHARNAHAAYFSNQLNGKAGFALGDLKPGDPLVIFRVGVGGQDFRIFST